MVGSVGMARFWDLVEAHFAQVNTQLRFSGFEVGLLLNFWQWPLKNGGIKRVVHTRA